MTPKHASFARLDSIRNRMALRFASHVTQENMHPSQEVRHLARRAAQDFMLTQQQELLARAVGMDIAPRPPLQNASNAKLGNMEWVARKAVSLGHSAKVKIQMC
jgi:hypothetical protein